MPDIKDSCVEWVGRIPFNWNRFRIKDICYILPKSNILAKDGEDTGLYPFYTSSQVLNKFFNKALYDGDTITMATGGFASVNYVKIPFSSSTDCFNIKTNQCTPFVSYFLYCIKDEVINKLWFEGMGIKHLQKDKLLNSNIFLPSITEQQKIAHFLDKKCSEIDSLSSDIEKQIKILEEYKKSIITEAVTKGLNPDIEMRDSGIEWIGVIPKHWSNHKLKYIVSALSSGIILQNNKLNDDGLYPVYGGGELIGYYDNFNIQDTIIIGRVGARCGCITKITGKAWATDNALVVKTCTNLQWLYYVLMAADLNTLNTANAQPLITGSKVLNMQIPVPPENEKEKISNFLDVKCTEIDAVIADKKAQLETLAEYKKSLIYEYVTGKKEVKY